MGFRDDVNAVVESALGGMPIGNTIEGRQRFSINVRRLAQEYRNSSDCDPAHSTIRNGTVPLAARRFALNGLPMIASEMCTARVNKIFNVWAGFREYRAGSHSEDKPEVTGIPSGYSPGMERIMGKSNWGESNVKSLFPLGTGYYFLISFLF